jgi:hypothetical protein
MRGFLIDPETQDVSIVETPGSLEDMYLLLGCELVDAVYLPEDDVLWVDDEGLLHEEVWAFTIYGKPLAGRSLVLGDDGAGGNTDAHTTLDVLCDNVRFLGKRRVNPEAIRPRVYFDNGNGPEEV